MGLSCKFSLEPIHWVESPSQKMGSTNSTDGLPVGWRSHFSIVPLHGAMSYAEPRFRFGGSSYLEEGKLLQFISQHFFNMACQIVGAQPFRCNPVILNVEFYWFMAYEQFHQCFFKDIFLMICYNRINVGKHYIYIYRSPKHWWSMQLIY